MPIEIPTAIIPPGVTWIQALKFGYVKRFDCPAYIEWLHTLPCCVSGSRTNVTAHHVVGHGLKGLGGKTHDLLAIPLVAELHLPDYPGGLHNSHAGGHPAWEEKHGSQLNFSALTLLQAIYDGVLVLGQNCSCAPAR